MASDKIKPRNLKLASWIFNAFDLYQQIVWLKFHKYFIKKHQLLFYVYQL